MSQNMIYAGTRLSAPPDTIIFRPIPKSNSQKEFKLFAQRKRNRRKNRKRANWQSKTHGQNLQNKHQSPSIPSDNSDDNKTTEKETKAVNLEENKQEIACEAPAEKSVDNACDEEKFLHDEEKQEGNEEISTEELLTAVAKWENQTTHATELTDEDSLISVDSPDVHNPAMAQKSQNRMAAAETTYEDTMGSTVTEISETVGEIIRQMPPLVASVYDNECPQDETAGMSELEKKVYARKKAKEEEEHRKSRPTTIREKLKMLRKLVTGYNCRLTLVAFAIVAGVFGVFGIGSLLGPLNPEKISESLTEMVLLFPCEGSFLNNLADGLYGFATWTANLIL